MTEKLFTIKDVAITKIYSEDRARKDLGDLTELKESITKSGLLNPILITQDHRLIAGERRLTACSELGHESIIVRIMPDLQPDDLMIIERMENVARKQFEWHEELELRHRLHNYWKSLAPVGEWGYRETAEKLNCSLGGLSTDLALADAIDNFPELKDMKTKGRARDAYKKMGEQAEAMMALDNLAPEEKERIKALTNGNMEFKPKGETKKKKEDKPEIKARHSSEETDMDAFIDEYRSHNEQPAEEEVPANMPEAVYVVSDLNNFLPQIPNNTVGLIELDPPYAIDFNINYGKTTKIKAKATDWSTDQLYDFYNLQLRNLKDKMLPNSWILCWTGKEHWLETNKIAEACGFGTQMPGIWVKPGGSTNTPKTTMISNYEMFLLFRNGKATFNTKSLLSTVNFNTPPSSQRIHQWEKPLDMYRYFISVLGRKGSIFLSPFAGSGNAMIAAGLYGMTPMGCDMDEKYIYKFYERYNNYFIKESE